MQRSKAVIDCRFADLGSPRRIWAVPSIHADVEKLQIIHDGVLRAFEPGDRIVYMGNYGGYGRYTRQTIDEILSFRRCLLSIAGVKHEDIVYLRGTQEEMWQKLMQLQFAPNPNQALEWMLYQGVAQTLESYGLSCKEALRISAEGVMRIARWTENLRRVVHSYAGHDIFGAQFKRAAYTNKPMQGPSVGKTSDDKPLLFVNAGIDVTKTLDDQGDTFWWGNRGFNGMRLPYKPFEQVIRGFDPEKGGLSFNPVSATLDGNCGRGGKLVCATLSGGGEMLQLLEA